MIGGTHVEEIPAISSDLRLLSARVWELPSYSCGTLISSSVVQNSSECQLG